MTPNWVAKTIQDHFVDLADQYTGYKKISDVLLDEDGKPYILVTVNIGNGRKTFRISVQEVK